MTPNLNFEPESFEAFSSSGGDLSREYENARDQRASVHVATVRSQHPVGSVVSVRDHPAAGSPAVVGGHHVGSVASVHRQPWRGGALSRHVTGFGKPGFIKGISRGYHGLANRFSGNRGWSGGRPFSLGTRGLFGWDRHPGYGAYSPYADRYRDHWRRRWPWLSQDSAGAGMAAGDASPDSGYPGAGYSSPGASGYAGSGYDGSDSAGSDSSFGFTPDQGAASSIGSPAPPDPQMVSWAQGCLAHLLGAWVPQTGQMDHLTQLAVEVFQGRSQLPSTGTLDDTTMAALHQACQAMDGTGMSASPASSPGQSSTPAPNVVTPDMNAGQTPPAGGAVISPPPTPPNAPSAAAGSGQPRELPYWSDEYEYENENHARTCEPDRCTKPYLNWLQNSLNQVFGQHLAVTGKLDDPTMAAINRFRLAQKLKINESYHIGPAIEEALLAAGASPPPAVPPAQCGPSDPNKLIPILDKARGDIPLEFLLAWVDVESAWVLEPPSVTCERGFFQLYPEDSVKLGLDHDRIGTDPVYSLQSGIRLINERARQQIERAVKAFGIPRGSDLYWHLVKLWHWIPSAPEKILASMSAQGVKATDWESVRGFVHDNSEALRKIIKRDPRDGIRSVDHMFARVNAWRRQLRR